MASEIQTGIASFTDGTATGYQGTNFAVSGGGSATSFSDFDPNLGTLNDIVTTLTVSGSFTYTLINTLDDGSAFVEVGVSVNTQILSAFGYWPTNSALSANLTAPTLDYTLNPSEVLSVPNQFNPPTNSSTETLDSRSELASFTGQNDFSLQLVVQPHYSNYSSDGVDYPNNISENVTLTIEYDYTPAAACYLANTKIQTAGGGVPIERLAIGDRVVTASGQDRPIRWIGQRSYGGRFLSANPALWPVVIKAGALDENVPSSDLFVSPRHAMFLDGVLVPAECLINGASIVQPEPEGLVEYIHLELDTHDVLLAEGAPSESFVDDDSRMMFHNAHEYDLLYPGAPRIPAFYCAPRVTEGYALQAIRDRLAVRAGIQAMDDPDPLRGFLDRAGVYLIEGWAQNPDRPEVPVCLDVLVDGVVVAQTLANCHRRDLADAGLGSGCHGFSVRSPRPLTPRQRETATVRRSSDQRVLERSFGWSRACSA